MAIAVKKTTDYRKFENTLYEVHPKTEAAQVVGASGTLADAFVGATASGMTITFTKADAATATATVTAPDGTSSAQGIVKLSDSTSGTEAAASGKTAATPLAVSAALTAAKNYADGLVTSAMLYKGTLGTGGTITALPASGNKTGDTYRVITAGTYAGEVCEVGDMIVCLSDGAGTWSVVQNNVDVFAGATSSAAGSIGLVPAPAAGDQAKVLNGNSSWVAVTGTSPVSVSATTSGIAVSLDSSGVTAGSYGPAANATPAHGSAFDVPYITVDSLGRVTAAATKTVTLPADNDTKVTQTVTTTAGEYPLLAKNTTSTTTATDTARFAAAVTVNPSSGSITASTFKGNLDGKLVNARDISLSGDATGSASFDGSADVTISATLASTGVTAGSYGLAANATPAYGNSFNVPYFTVDAKGRVTAASTQTVTLPAVSDTKVTQTVTTTSGEYPLLAKNTTATATVTDGARFAAAVTVNPSTGKISATAFNDVLVSSAAPTEATDISGLADGGVYVHYYS